LQWVEVGKLGFTNEKNRPVINVERTDPMIESVG